MGQCSELWKTRLRALGLLMRGLLCTLYDDVTNNVSCEFIELFISFVIIARFNYSATNNACDKK